MIVRIQGEGQYELDDDARQRLDELDGQLFKAVDTQDSPNFHKVLKALVDLIEERGTKVPNDRVVPSDLILPPSDISVIEAKRLFTDEGYLQPVEA